MENASLAMGKPQDPEEGAHVPLLPNSNMSIVEVMKKGTNVTIVHGEKPHSHSASSYKEALSQAPESITHRQKLLWLQKRRSQGLWVQCDECNKWRYLQFVLDKHELPKKWYCKMNPDPKFSSCSVTEVPICIHDEEDLIYSEYNAGSLVLARVAGWPWWPAMVDDCPDTEQYYWLDGLSDIPTHYHVVFFDAFEVTRAWLAPSQLKAYSGNKNLLKLSLRNKSNRKRLEVARTQINDAQKLNQEERLTKYSFITRYKGTIAPPIKVNKDLIKKFKKQFKKKYSVGLPNELSDSETDSIDENANNKNPNTPYNDKETLIVEIELLK